MWGEAQTLTTAEGGRSTLGVRQNDDSTGPARPTKQGTMPIARKAGRKQTMRGAAAVETARRDRRRATRAARRRASAAAEPTEDATGEPPSDARESDRAAAPPAHKAYWIPW